MLNLKHTFTNGLTSSKWLASFAHDINRGNEVLVFDLFGVQAI